MLITLAATFLLNSPAHAIVVEPIQEAAETLGFRIVGEIEYARGAVKPPAPQLGDRLADVNHLCPDLTARPAAEAVRLLILSWADQEFPTPTVARANASARGLAELRGAHLARELRTRLPGELSFELINMATRTRHQVRPGRRAVGTEATDVKTALVDAGAAPTNPFETGLFGEYAQASKAVILVDCDAGVTTPRTARRGTSQLVVGANFANP